MIHAPKDLIHAKIVPSDIINLILLGMLLKITVYSEKPFSGIFSFSQNTIIIMEALPKESLLFAIHINIPADHCKNKADADGTKNQILHLSNHQEKFNEKHQTENIG